jgi:HK97 family phage major capsid protein
METLTIEKIDARIAEIKERLQEIDGEFAGAPLPEDRKEEWNTLNEEREEKLELRAELVARTERLAELDTREGNRDEPFQTRRPGVATGDDIYDLSTIRMSVTSPEEGLRELRDRALRSVEKAHFAHPEANREECQAHIERLLHTIDGPSDDGGKVPGELARRILVTGSPAYARAFGKNLKGTPLSNEESRALSLGTGSAGGFAIVYTLDPTIIPTSNLNVNPWRALANVEQIAGTNEWRGVTSGAVTAHRVAEGTEAVDDSPTLAQPALVVTKVHTFIPFSVELGQDWGALQTEMARLIQDAKDVEEGTSFAKGNGTTPNPQGVVTGALTGSGEPILTAGVAAFVVGDVYKVWEAVGARFRPKASWVGNLSIYDLIRQFATTYGPNVFVQNLQIGTNNIAGTTGGSIGAQLLGKGCWESTDMDGVLTTGSNILVVGDFNYYKIVDRIGMDIEVVPHLFGATSRYPTGQRGIYAYWRNMGRMLSPNAFAILQTK